jgi:hypothetical protein
VKIVLSKIHDVNLKRFFHSVAVLKRHCYGINATVIGGI